MAEKDPDPTSRPGIPEALDPSLANGALWETEPNHLNLKTIDPLKFLDTYLIDAETQQQIINQWNGIIKEIKPEILEDASDESIVSTIEDLPNHDVLDENSISPESELKEVQKSDWVEGNLSSEEESEVQPLRILEEEPIVAEAEISGPEELESPKAEKVGKRIRKVVKKARKEGDSLKRHQLSVPETENIDSQLSPYTKWLKGLRGSEYIHPYEDDFGLGNLSGRPNAGVSETFAELLASQGYKEQAIEMYRQLIKKNPEKSSFFAAKIEALK